MSAGQIVVIAIIAACGFTVLVATLSVAVILAAEAYGRHVTRRLQPRQRAAGPDPELAPGAVPAVLLTHNFSMVESTIPDGMTITNYRRHRRLGEI